MQRLPVKLVDKKFNDPHTKANILLQVRLGSRVARASEPLGMPGLGARCVEKRAPCLRTVRLCAGA